ncbi:putative baseplate assembly protein [Streptomyces sp. APSN-46.1]|uniref:putative baseplate assembly protein n=1 Tax=Streptomyces sp. APSN-46.1 TaxID=2929049 RepID=UPI001FB313C7|nr:putative baseplate assembly protein [Streptomyces sp. APSN-46.1]MCJ1676506.1 putative baseplate assembly protein [Streptomyces sp. APSN-46.1]
MTPESKRGRVQPPNLDDRTWQDLAEEMRALRTSYAPQWTDDQPSDIGITLIELFAWLGEGIIYRLNQVPEKNYIAFLNMMGITRDPATPAATHLAFSTKAASVRVPAGTQAHTLPAEGEAPIVFETDEEVTVLPFALTTALLLTPDPDDDSLFVYEDVSADLVGTGAGRRLIPVRPARTTHLCLGFEDAAPGEIVLRPRLFRPVPEFPVAQVTWAFSTPEQQPDEWPGIGPVGTTTDLHDRPVRLPVAASWTAQNPDEDWGGVSPAAGSPFFGASRFWIDLRITHEVGAPPLEIGLDQVLFNAAPAHTALTLRAPEMLGESTGEPFQVFALRHRPLYRRPDLKAPYADLEVQVGQGTPPVWETWQLVPELLPGPGTVYRLNPVTGEIGFGSHGERDTEGHGSIPPPGSLIRARKYRYVASGTAGNVSGSQIVVVGTKPDGTVPTDISGVTNIAAAIDGCDEEPIEETLRRAPEELKIRNRAVTADDYAYLAREATSDVRISRCLAPHPRHGTPWTFGGIDRAPGNVTVIVVPDQGKLVARPEPPPELIDAVRGYLDERRDLTVRLFVHGPRYLPVVTKVSVVVWREAARAGVETAQVEADVRRKITDFLHPTRGGPDGRGWEVGQHVFGSDLFRAVMPSEEVGYIEQITVAPGPPAYPGNRPFAQPPPGASVQVADYELVCAGPSTVTVKESPS